MDSENKIATVGDCRELSGTYFLWENLSETKCVTYQEAVSMFTIDSQYEDNQLVKLSDLSLFEGNTFDGILQFENNSPNELIYVRIGCGGKQIGQILGVPAHDTVDILLVSNNAGNGAFVQSCTLTFAYSMYGPKTCSLRANGYTYTLTGEDLDDKWEFTVTLDMAQDWNNAVLTA